MQKIGFTKEVLQNGVLIKPVVTDLPTPVDTTTDLPISKDGDQQYYTTGAIVDTNGKPIMKASIQLFDTTGAPLTQPFATTNGTYEAWTSTPDNVFISFKASGYADVTKSFSDLLTAPDIIMLKGNSSLAAFPYWMVLLVLLAVYSYRKRTGKVGAFATGDVLAIFLLIGGVVGLDIIKKILEGLGLWKSKDTKDLDDAASDPESFWTSSYWQTIKPPDKQYTYAWTTAQAKAIVDTIYNCFGPFNDDEDTAIAQFKLCRTKANCSFLAWVFEKYYSMDLLTFLRGGNWPQDRLSDADVNTINKYIAQLPNY